MLISAPDIIKQSWYLYAKHWKKLLPYMGWLLIPNVILGLSGLISLYLDKYIKVGPFILINNIVITAIFVASIVFSLWVTIATTKFLKETITNQPTIQFKENLMVTSTLLWPVIYTSVFVMLIVAGGTLLLIIPGIIFSVWYAFAFYAVIFDNQKGTKAMQFSKNLVTGRWWIILLRLAVPSIFFGLILVTINYIINFGLNFILTDSAYTVITGLLTSTVNVLIAPLTALTGILLYLSAKENPVQIIPPPTNITPQTK
ncbi:MAG: hypothetical protein COU29_01790 [Candidatus Magasanikbacteria bacterium CG10_big_fil_rev_8_21_14_0_10_36_32]|uniref:Glycerophosphoryl diester phosphodiesterase membrane domain-containing protein n=1 Tax=Candidatus Magasanikbacteria bacterium CG10_big_fil_rev_8_21_14_0_10_36_32 TaxID=1974646 RepID=A0A2M6W6Y5_9BACT|nr:MAG: hypothetical protein COU29_01790 [Candidatus Magasanikbacteria bacterium CG10_big_fil_rev_8_21_14_0_10_36_32]